MWWGVEGRGHPLAVTHFRAVLRLGPKTPTALAAWKGWPGGWGQCPMSQFLECWGLVCCPPGDGGSGEWVETLCSPKGLGPKSTQESYLLFFPSLSHPLPLLDEIPPMGLLPSPPIYLPLLLLPLIPPPSQRERLLLVHPSSNHV